MWVYFAWVDDLDVEFDPGEHTRTDHMRVIGFEITKEEGEYAVLEIETENPGVGVLSAARKQYGLLSISETGRPGDAVLMFRGMIQGLPSDLGGDDGKSITFEFIAQPVNAAARLREFARGLRVAPYFDRLFMGAGDPPKAPDDPLDPEVEDTWDPTEVLEARSAVFDVDEVTHEHDIVDYLEGSRELDLGRFFDASSLEPSMGEPPVPSAVMTVSCEWVQRAQAETDIGPYVDGGGFTTMSNMQALDTEIMRTGSFGADSGWSVVDSAIRQWGIDEVGPFLTGKQKVWTGYHLNPDGSADLNRPLPPGKAKEKRYLLKYYMNLTRLVVKGDYQQSRREIAIIRMDADVQPILGSATREEVMDAISLSSLTEDTETPEWEPETEYKEGDVVQHKGKCWKCVWPHKSLLWFSFLPEVKPVRWAGAPEIIFQWERVPTKAALQKEWAYTFYDTDRGRQAIEHAILRVRAFLRHRMRCFTVKFRGSWESLGDVTLKDSVRIEHDFFPRGQGGKHECKGKVIAYRKVWDGRTGTRYVEVTLGVSAGRGDPPRAKKPGIPYSVAMPPYGYVPDGLPEYETEDIRWKVKGPPYRWPINVEALRSPSYIVQQKTWNNLAGTQSGYAAGAPPGGAAAAVAAHPTSLSLRLRSLAATDTLVRRLAVPCSPVTGPKGIDVEWPRRIISD